MAAAWGGYVFVLNMVAAHTGLLLLLGRHSARLHRAYSLFYLVGTALAIQIPVVGYTPLKSLEQLGALAVFLVVQLFELVRVMGERRQITGARLFALRLVVLGLGAVGAAAVAGLLGKGYFGPLSARIRSLFVQHTRTGNPLVDSVAEHQPASADACVPPHWTYAYPRARAPEKCIPRTTHALEISLSACARASRYWQYLHALCYAAPVGFVAVLFRRRDASWFLIAFAIAACVRGAVVYRTSRARLSACAVVHCPNRARYWYMRVRARGYALCEFGALLTWECPRARRGLYMRAPRGVCCRGPSV